MTRNQKRMFVQLRLGQSDAAAMSDRALARELGVSQPFVGKQRRLLGLRTTAKADEFNVASECGPTPAASKLVAVDRWGDRWSVLGPVRRFPTTIEFDNSCALRDGDPFD